MTAHSAEAIAQARAMRAKGVRWKLIERELGDGIITACASARRKELHPPKTRSQGRAAPRRPPLRKCRYRMQVLSNAFYGLRLEAGFGHSEWVRGTIRVLRSRGLLLGNIITDAGLETLIEWCGGRRAEQTTDGGK